MLKENRRSQKRFHWASKEESLKDKDVGEGCKIVFKDVDQEISGFYSYDNALVLFFITAPLCRLI